MVAGFETMVDHKRAHAARAFRPFLLAYLTSLVASAKVTPLQRWNLTYSPGLNAPGTTREVRVPSTVYGGLVAAGAFETPFYGRNLELVNASEFDAPVVFSATLAQSMFADVRVAVLELDGINYRARVDVDGVALQAGHAGGTNTTLLVGTYRSFRLPIPRHIWDGKSSVTLRVVVERPVDMWKPGSNSTDLAISFIDWNPEAPDSSMGIWRPARLVTYPYETGMQGVMS